MSTHHPMQFQIDGSCPTASKYDTLKSKQINNESFKVISTLIYIITLVFSITYTVFFIIIHACYIIICLFCYVIICILWNKLYAIIYDIYIYIINCAFLIKCCDIYYNKETKELKQRILKFQDECKQKEEITSNLAGKLKLNKNKIDEMRQKIIMLQTERENKINAMQQKLDESEFDYSVKCKVKDETIMNMTSEINKYKNKMDTMNQNINNLIMKLENQKLVTSQLMISHQHHHGPSFVWQWLDNDGSWKLYDATTSTSLEALSVGNQLRINAGKYTYDITKISNKACKQINTETKKSRQSRRVLITGRYFVRWQVLRDDNKWECLSKDNINTKRNLRRILYDSTNKKRVVWQFKNDKNDWSMFEDIDLMLKISDLLNGAIHEYSRGKFKYKLTKIDESRATQINIKTNKIRECRMVFKNMDEMDPNWILNVHSAASGSNNKDNARYIYNKFCETWTDGKVKVISMDKINNKALAARTNAYNEFLKGKKEELKDQVERILFHGTSFKNVDKIISNGFNRDFNRRHAYGKGSYFSNRADISKGYCTKNNKDEYVMLICRVIIGQYAKGKQIIDGSSWPIKSDGKTPYESCVNNIKSPTIFVINNDSHAVPTHILTFKYMK